MIPAEVRIEINQDEVKAFIEKRIQQQIDHELLFIDINKLAEITSMSKRFLEDEILCDPRVRVNERRKTRKRWWLYKPTIEAIKNITEEW